MESKYKHRFDRLREEGKDLFVLKGKHLLVEIIEQEIKLGGGLVYQADTKQRVGGMNETMGQVAMVLVSGTGYYNPETGEESPCDHSPGDILLLPRFATTAYSIFPGINEPTNNKLAFVDETSVILSFKGVEALNQATKLLNS